MTYTDKFGNVVQCTVDEYIEVCKKTGETIPDFGNSKSESVDKWNKFKKAGITITEEQPCPSPFYKSTGSISSTIPL